MNIKTLRPILLVCLGFLVLPSHGASPPVSGSPLLVLTGASYVADWGLPAIPGYRVVNKGVGGQESSEVRARFDRDVMALSPRKVLIWGHINNIHRAKGDMDVVKAQAREDYRAMVTRARAAGMDVLLATEVTLPRANGWTDLISTWITELRGRETYATRVNKHVTEINEWLRQYAAQEGLKLLDFERDLAGDGGYRKAVYTTDDGTHISKQAYEVLSLSLRRSLGA